MSSLNIEVSQLLETPTNPPRCVDNKDVSCRSARVLGFLNLLLTLDIIRRERQTKRKEKERKTKRAAFLRSNIVNVEYLSLLRK